MNLLHSADTLVHIAETSGPAADWARVLLAFAAPERMVGLPRSAPGLRHETCHEGDVRFFKVTTIPPPPEPGPGGMLMTPPHQEVEAYVSAQTGGVYWLKSTPKPRRRIIRKKKRAEGEGADG